MGQDGGVWAQSAKFPAITPSEVEALNKGFTEPAGSFSVGNVKVGSLASGRPASDPDGCGR